LKSNFGYISDAPKSNEIIGGVSIYPSDDPRHLHQVSPTSRDLVDLFCKKHDSDSYHDKLMCALARRLTAIEGGVTEQNLNMLNLL